MCGKVTAAAPVLCAASVAAQKLYKLNVFRHNRLPTGMNGDHISIGKEACNHGLGHSMQSINRIRSDVLNLSLDALINQDLSNQAPERGLWNA